MIHVKGSVTVDKATSEKIDELNEYYSFEDDDIFNTALMLGFSLLVAYKDDPCHARLFCMMIHVFQEFLEN